MFSEETRAVLQKPLIETHGGLYIKELISGDNGRTRPSLTEILQRPARVSRLDVVQVERTREE